MPSPTIPVTAALLLAAVPGAARAPAASEPGNYRLAQLVIQQQVLVRVRRPLVTPVEWVEKKGPKCIAADALAGVVIARPDAVDLVLEGGGRVRARLDDDCPALNFYGGFYLKPNKDGKVCADRDAIRSRSGRMCEIDSFKKLVTKK